MNRLAVVKFGGTCLSDPTGREKAVEHCRVLLDEFEQLVVVVSAMGRDDAPYSTDSLMALAPASFPRERDVLMACGEVISAVVLAGMLRKNGFRAEALTGWGAGIMTDGVHCRSEIDRIYTGRIMKSIKENRCAVVAGFQGAGPEGNVTTIGRGGSDTSALALAAALDADGVILFKTVEGVYSADPEKVPAATGIRRISAEDIRQMGLHGARIVHPRAVELAIEAGKKIQIRSHECGENVTDIEPYVFQSGRYITGVTSGPEVVQFRVEYDRALPRTAFYANIFRLIADAGVSMDMFSVFDEGVMFTVPCSEKDSVSDLLKTGKYRFRSREPYVKVSIVGSGMHGLLGVMARLSEALARIEVEILQTVDSHATISVLVHLEHCEKALRELHREFIE